MFGWDGWWMEFSLCTNEMDEGRCLFLDLHWSKENIYYVVRIQRLDQRVRVAIGISLRAFLSFAGHT